MKKIMRSWITTVIAVVLLIIGIMLALSADAIYQAIGGTLTLLSVMLLICNISYILLSSHISNWLRLPDENEEQIE